MAWDSFSICSAFPALVGQHLCAPPLSTSRSAIRCHSYPIIPGHYGRHDCLRPTAHERVCVDRIRHRPEWMAQQGSNLLDWVADSGVHPK